MIVGSDAITLLSIKLDYNTTTEQCSLDTYSFFNLSSNNEININDYTCYTIYIHKYNQNYINIFLMFIYFSGLTNYTFVSDTDLKKFNNKFQQESIIYLFKERKK